MLLVINALVDDIKKFKFTLKKFLFYLLFAMPACSMPFGPVAIFLGAPSVIIMAIFVAIYDLSTVTDIHHPPKIFTTTAFMLWILEVVLVGAHYLFEMNGINLIIEYLGFRKIVDFVFY